MKKLLYSLVGLACMLCFSCTDTDNYDGPNAGLGGKLIDKSTGKNFITGQEDFTIRIWEMSWSENPTPQDIPVKQDGTFNDSKLFSATYDMQPYGGPFWPVERETNIKLSGYLEKDFEVIPYLQVADVTHRLEGTNLILSCRLKAPIPQDLPRVLEIRPFVSQTQYCSDGVKIDEYNDNKYRREINANWWDGVGDPQTGEGFETYVLPELPLKSGRTYSVRIGARVEDTYRKFNYSDIITIKVP